MYKALLLAVPMGLSLSFAAGPIFFVVIETSIANGRKKALLLDLGSVCADLVFIALAFWGSQSLIDFLHQAWVISLAALGLIIYGIYSIWKSRKTVQFSNDLSLTRKRWFFLKGFMINILNLGTLFYWLTATVAIGSVLHHDREHMLIFFGLVILIYLLIDWFKIGFASRFKARLKGRGIQLVERIMGIVMIGLGLFIALHSFFTA